MSMTETFIQKVEAATKARSKEIRISLQDAQVLVIEMSGTIARENNLLTKIVLLQDAAIKKTEEKPVSSNDTVMDGGSFKE